MKGFQHNVVHKLTSFSGHLQITRHASRRSNEAPPFERKKLNRLKEVFPTAIQTTKAFAHKVILLKQAENVEGIVCKGLDPEAMHENLCTHLSAGQMIGFNHSRYNSDIILSNKTAQRLRVQVGDDVVAYMIQNPPRYRKLRVVGLYHAHIAELDERLAFCDLRLIQHLQNWSEELVEGYEVFLNDFHQVHAVAEQLSDWLDYDLCVQTTDDAYAALFDWLLIVKKNALIFIILILLVVGSNLASIVFIQILERTVMIGLLKTLGATQWTIRHIMLWNNWHMTWYGMLWGNLIGMGFCALQQYTKLIPLNPTYYHIDHVPIAWDWGVILGLNALTCWVITTTLLVTTAAVVSLKPAGAVRFR